MSKVNSKKIENLNQFNRNALEEYFKNVEVLENYSLVTLQHYNVVLLDFLTYLDKTEISILDIDIFENYFMTIKDKLKISSKNNYIKIIRKFIVFCEKEMYITNHFSNKICTIKEEYLIQNPFTQREIVQIFKKLSRDFTSSVIRILYWTGVRVSELINILIDDVDLKNNEIKIYGKGKKVRYVTIPRSIKNDVKNLILRNKNFLIEYNKKPVNRQKINSMLNEFAKKNKLTFTVHPHKFRRSLATHLMESNVGLKDLQTLLGHQSIVSTEKYIKLSKEQLKKKVLNVFDK